MRHVAVENVGAVLGKPCVVRAGRDDNELRFGLPAAIPSIDQTLDLVEHHIVVGETFGVFAQIVPR